MKYGQALIAKLRQYCRLPQDRAVWGTGLLGFLLSRAVMYGALAPFGVAFLTVQRQPKRLAAAFIGAVFGTLSAARIDVLRYLASTVIAGTVTFILRPLPLAKRKSFAAAVSALSIGATGLISPKMAETSLSVLLFAAELLLSACGGYLFACTVRSGQTIRRGYFAQEKRMIAQFAMAALCVSGFPVITVGAAAISVGRAAALIAVIAGGYAARMYGGVVVGITVGLIMDLTTAVSPVYTALYALIGIAAGVIPRKRRRWMGVAAELITVLAVILLPQSVRLYGAMVEGALAGIVFAILPPHLLACLPQQPQERGESHYEVRLRRHIQAKLHGLAEAYEDVARSMGVPQQTDNFDEVEQFAIACEMVCGTCRHWSLCCSEIARDKAAIRRMLARGSAEPGDFCTAIRTRCPQMDAFCTGITFSLRAGRERRLRISEHREARTVLTKQYGQIAALIDGEAANLSAELRFERDLERDVKKLVHSMGAEAEVLAYRDIKGYFHVELCAPTLQPIYRRVDELTELLKRQTGTNFGRPEQLEGRTMACLSFAEQPAFYCRIGAAAEKRRGKGISGDCGTYFYGKNGCLFVILCDGMGSGFAAHEEAVRTVKLLESLLKAGIAAADAAEIIRSAVAISCDGEQFATIDIAVIDPAGSELQTVKFRAAPTYVRRKQGDGYVVRTLGAKSSVVPDAVICESTKLREHDTVLLASDGVTAACGNADFCACLSKLYCHHPRELAELILKMARTDGEHDDRTVIALTYEKSVMTERKAFANG